MRSHPIYLLVEGKMDGQFFFRLIDRMGLKETMWLEDRETEDGTLVGVGGKKGFGAVVKAITVSPEYFSRVVKTIVIVRDADNDPALAFAESQNALRGNGLIPPDAPGELSSANKSGVKSAVYIMPDASSAGYIETLFIRALMDEPHFAMGCVDEVWGDFLTCFHRAGQPIEAHKHTKKQFNLFLIAVLDDLPTQTAHNYIFDTTWFPWESAAFVDVKQFLTALAADTQS